MNNIFEMNIKICAIILLVSSQVILCNEEEKENNDDTFVPTDEWKPVKKGNLAEKLN